MNGVSASGWPPSGTVNPTSLKPRLSEQQRRRHTNRSAEGTIHNLTAAAQRAGRRLVARLRDSSVPVACATHSSASMNTRCGFRAVVSPPPASTSCIWSRASNSFIAIDRGGARHWYRSSHPATRTQRTYSLQCSAARQGATGCSGASEKAAATCRAAGAALRLQAPASWYDTHAAPCSLIPPAPTHRPGQSNQSRMRFA